jgi:activator of 2-hydroxyglutaryl-CoA dehydratase
MQGGEDRGADHLQLQRLRARGNAVSGLLLGVDIGTSSSKGVLSRPDGEVVATAQREHELSDMQKGEVNDVT